MMSDTKPPSNAPGEATERARPHQNGRTPVQVPVAFHIPPAYLPGGEKSLAAISIRAFGLGFAVGLAALLIAILAYMQMALWRAPFFIATLAVFHYLEFDMTARYNPPDAKVASFLLVSNGSAYNIAHTAAMGELLLRQWLRSTMKPEWLSLPFRIPTVFPTVSAAVPVGLGIVLVLVGQYVRSAAMATAGKNFNHLVQYTKKDDHVLVTNGVYALSRHPAYFGFFWWGLGTQLVLGNHICFWAYTAVLWKFFATRIMRKKSFSSSSSDKIT